MNCPLSNTLIQKEEFVTHSKKQIRPAMWMFLAGFFFPVGGAYAGPIVAVQPANQSVVAGALLSVNVVISGATDLYAYQFDVGFDPTILTAIQVSEGPFLSTGGATFFVPPVIDNSSGQISGTADSLLTAISGVNGSGVLATIQFRALAQGTSVVNSFNGVFLDSSLSGIDVTTQGGSVSVTGVASPEPATVLLASFALLGLVGLAVRRGRGAGVGCGSFRRL